MAKKILVISSSLRNNGNSDRLADEWIKGAVSAGNQVEKISLAGKKIQFCLGCLQCQKTGKCVIQDDAISIVQKMYEAEVIVFASPVYYYCISGQLKTLLDRANPLYGSDYKFREIYLLSTAAEDEETTVEYSKNAIQGWVDCFERAKLRGVVFAGGVNEVNDIVGHKALKEAFQMGEHV